jgi:hypothetical protein
MSEALPPCFTYAFIVWYSHTRRNSSLFNLSLTRIYYLSTFRGYTHIPFCATDTDYSLTGFPGLWMLCKVQNYICNKEAPMNA